MTNIITSVMLHYFQCLEQCSWSRWINGSFVYDFAGLQLLLMMILWLCNERSQIKEIIAIIMGYLDCREVEYLSRNPMYKDRNKHGLEWNFFRGRRQIILEIFCFLCWRLWSMVVHHLASNGLSGHTSYLSSLVGKTITRTIHWS